MKRTMLFLVAALFLAPTFGQSGHDAGYEWAEENEIADEMDCDGNSNSFNEGEEYVEEQREAQEEEEEDEDE